MRLSSLNLGHFPDPTTFLNGVTLGAARPPPPLTPNAADGVASGSAVIAVVAPSASGSCPAGTTAMVGLGGKKICKKIGRDDRPKAGVKTPSNAPGSNPSPAPAVYSPNEDGSAPTTISPQGEGTGSMPWKKYATWAAYGVGGLVLAFGAWKGVKMLKAKRAAGRDEPL